jgi:Spy/CpxP family protein refolding chaperone
MVAPALALFATSLLWLAPAFAQHNGGGSPGGPAWGQNGGQPPFGRQSNGYPHGPNPGAPPVGSWPDDGGGHSGRMRGGFQLGPPGRWWNDDNFAKSLGLDRDQQHRMDEIFKASKGQLFGLYKGLRHEEAQLDKLSRAKVLDESQIDTQIDKVVQARGELEKANAHMLLEIRKQMTPEQTARLDERRPPPPPNED